MGTKFRLTVASDIHYASPAEQARGPEYEARAIDNAALRLFIRHYRGFFWARDPLHQNHLLDHFLHQAQGQMAVVCGDLTCDTGFAGISDPAAFQSASDCVGRIRQRFGENVRVAHGDHDLGKLSFFGKQGGMRLRSFEQMQSGLGLPAFWRVETGNYALLGIASSLVALPAFEAEALESEKEEWRTLRAAHMRQIESAFKALGRDQKVLLFCHDPTALPFLLENDRVRAALDQVEHTFVGHLHSRLILTKSRLLAGMPHIRFLGHTVSKLSAALRTARLWRPFKVVLCPSLAGIELLKDGGFCEVELDPEARIPAKIQLRKLGRARTVSTG